MAARWQGTRLRRLGPAAAVESELQHVKSLEFIVKNEFEMNEAATCN